MPPDNLTRLSIAEAGDLFRRRALSPVELARAYLDRIRRLDADLLAYITVLQDEALAAAAAAEREIARGEDRGPLHGIPIALKDLVMTRGVRTTCGSRILREWVPDTDATVARRLADAGAVLLGKLNMHEFAYGPTGVNPHYGTSRNPWDRHRIPGGPAAAPAWRWRRASAPGPWERTPAAPCGSRPRCVASWVSSPPTAG
jgi:aspartyl-tRNA(Asn)/glutamyl-tRNA(Gln) amidotransferase subunit A